MRENANRRLKFETLIWMLLALGAYILSLDIPDQSAGYRFGAAGWPRFICYMMFIGAVVQFAVSTYHARAAERALTGAEGLPHDLIQTSHDAAHVINEPTEKLGKADAMRVVAVFALPVLYTASLNRIGFYAATPVFVLALLFALGERRILPLLGIGLFISAVIIFFFTTLFYVPLPTGNLPGFYDFNSWFVQAVRF